MYFKWNTQKIAIVYFVQVVNTLHQSFDISQGVQSLNHGYLPIDNRGSNIIESQILNTIKNNNMISACGLKISKISYTILVYRRFYI